jgi:hypothetical protein
MKYKIREEQLKPIIQNLIDTQLQNMKDETEDWGLGEMYEMEVLDSVDHITIDRINTVDKIKVYINLYLTKVVDNMQDFRGELQYRLESWIPNIEIYINEYRNLEGGIIDIDNDYWDV